MLIKSLKSSTLISRAFTTAGGGHPRDPSLDKSAIDKKLERHHEYKGSVTFKPLVILGPKAVGKVSNFLTGLIF